MIKEEGRVNIASRSVYWLISVLVAIFVCSVFAMRIFRGGETSEELYSAFGFMYGFHLFFSSIMMETIGAPAVNVRRGERKLFLRLILAFTGLLMIAGTWKHL